MPRIQPVDQATGDRPMAQLAPYRYRRSAQARFLTWKLWMTSLPSLTYSLGCIGAALSLHVE